MGQINFKIKIDEKEPIIIKTPEQIFEETKELYARYKLQNPIKYEMKKAAFEAKLELLDPKREEKMLAKAEAEAKAKAEADKKAKAEAKK